MLTCPVRFGQVWETAVTHVADEPEHWPAWAPLVHAVDDGAHVDAHALLVHARAASHGATGVPHCALVRHATHWPVSTLQ
jgi:hypothetical protein